MTKPLHKYKVEPCENGKVMQTSQNVAWTHRALEKANDDEGTANVASQETQTQAQ